MRRKRLKEMILKLLFIFSLLSLITYLHYFVFKTLLSEMLHLFTSGFLIAYLWFTFSIFLSPQLRRNILIFIYSLLIGGFIFALADPIMKPWLDRILGINTVATFKESIITNFVCFLIFLSGWFLGLKIFKKHRN